MSETQQAGGSAVARSNESTDQRLIAIFLIVLIDVLGLTIILPLLPFYSEHFGASATTVGALVSTYALCQLIAGPILGHWSDRIGRKPILILSQIGTCIGFLILASAHSLFWVFVSRIIDGLTAGNLSTAQAYISDIATPQNRAKELGRISTAFAIGFFIGPGITAALYRYGYYAPILAAASLSFLSIMASTFLLPSHQKPKDGPAAGAPPAAAPSGATSQLPAKRGGLLDTLQYFKRPVLSRLFLEIFLFYFSFSAYIAGFALFAERRFTVNGVPLDARQVGYAFAYFGFLGIITQTFLIGRVVKRFGERQVTLAGFVASCIGYGMLAWTHEPLWIAITGLFTSFGGGVLRPVLISQIAGSVSPKERGRVIGVNQSIQSAAQIVAPLISTALIGASRLSEWALLPSLVSALGIFLVVLRTRDTRTAEENVKGEIPAK